MNTLRNTAAVIGLLLLAACAHPDLLRAGMTRQELDARFGAPAAMRHDPDGDVLIYSSAPLGQRASAAHLDAQGRVLSVEPLLNTEHFATIRVGEWNKHEVFTHFGTPAEISFKAHATGRFRIEWHAVADKNAKAGAHHAPPLAILEVRPK